MEDPDNGQGSCHEHRVPRRPGHQGLSEIQARAILDMRLGRLTGLEIEKLEAEYAEVQEKIAYYKTILGDRNVLVGLIKEDLDEMLRIYGDERRTELCAEPQGSMCGPNSRRTRSAEVNLRHGFQAIPFSSIELVSQEYALYLVWHQ